MSAPRQNGDAPSRRNIAGKAASLARTRTPAGAQESAHGKHGKRRTRSLCLRQCSEGGRRAGQASARERVRHLPQKRAPQRADFAAQRRIRASPRAERRKNAQKSVPKRAGRSADRAGFDKASGAGSATRRGRLNLRLRAVPGNVGWASEERAGAPQNFGRGRGATCVIRRSRASTPLEPGVSPAQDDEHFSGCFASPPAQPAEKAPVAGTRPTRSAGRKTGSPDSAPFQEQPCGTSLQ